MSYAFRTRLFLSLCALILAASCSGETGGTFDRIRKNKQVLVGTDAVNLPFEFGKGMGVQGLDVDVAEEIAKDIGFEIRWIKTPFERLFTALQNREVDFVISAISITDERKKNVAFSTPYFTSGQIVATRREMEKIKTIADLAGLRIGVQTGTTGDEFLAHGSRLSKFDKKGFATLDDALLALNNREVDAVIGDQPILSYSIFTTGAFNANLRTVGERLTTESYGVVVRKDDAEMLKVVNKTLERLKSSGKQKEVYTKWFGDVEKGIAKQLREEAEAERLRTTPRTVVFQFIKDPSFNFKMSRLDGYNVVLKSKATGAVTKSTAIETQGNTGRCQLSVLPGVYALSMVGFNLRDDEWEVPISQSMTLTSRINLATSTTIDPPK